MAVVLILGILLRSGQVCADWYYSFTLSDPGQYGVGGDTETHFKSETEALLAIRAYNRYEGTLFWKNAEQVVADPTLVVNANLPKDGYLWGGELPLHSTADEACTVGLAQSCSTCSYTGVKIPLAPYFYDRWVCQVQFANPNPPPAYINDFWNGVMPACLAPGY